MKKKNFFKIISICLIISHLFIPYVYADDIDVSEEFSFDSLQVSSTITSSLSINSRAYVVIDRNTNSILLEKNSNQKRKMASTTKIMTAIVVIEHRDLSEIATISKKSANTGGSRLGLKTGDKVSVRDLLYGLMLKSGNDAAVALAEYVGGSVEGFANLMNNKANELGLKNTHFVTPHGLDNDNHYTTAYELALLANYAMKNKTFASIVGTKSCTISINGYSKTIDNTNELLGNLNGVYGIKTGFTNGANRCLVSACKRGNLDLICVVLGADTKKFRTTDSIKLLEYSFENFKLIDIGKLAKDKFTSWKEEYEKNSFIDKGLSNNISIDMKNFEHLIIPINKEKVSSLCVEIKCDKDFIAPIHLNQVIGKIYIKCDNEVITSSDIFVTKEIPKKDIWNYLNEFLSNYISYFKNFA